VLRDYPGALHVRLDGPEALRAQQAATRLGIDEDTARRQLHQADRARAAYTHHLYGHDPSEADLYQLVIDTTAVPLPAAVDVIVAAAQAA